MGDCFLGAVFNQIKPTILGYFFLSKGGLCINFDKNWAGDNFGRFFSQTHLVTLKTSTNETLFSCDTLRQKSVPR
jgi:hypothetical protein